MSGVVAVASEAELIELLGTPTRAVLEKSRTSLHAWDQAWIGASPFCLLATAAGGGGALDVSPRGDPAGFVHIENAQTLVLPERPGNRRADSLRNILQQPQVGLLFLIPGRDTTLRINGCATVVRDAPYFDKLNVHGHRPKVAISIAIEEIFFHCAKAFMRSHLWSPETWQQDQLPSHAQIVKDAESRPDTLEALQLYYGPDYAAKLYK